MNNKTYFQELSDKIDKAYSVAQKAREKGFDPARSVEAVPAGDLATRVEGLVGPPGVAEMIKKHGRENITKIIDDVLGEIIGLPKKEQEKKIDQALRTGLAIITEGVVAAPLEGISHVEINENPDGSNYLSLFFSGPIRSAGGTAQGLAVLIGDHLRHRANLQDYRPTDEELERYVEEINFYNDRVSRLQYKPSDDDIKFIVKSCAICIDGDPTDKKEVSIHRNLKRVHTNRIRGGLCLVIGEGIAQKAKKLLKYNESFGLDWFWLADLGKQKVAKEDTDGKKPEKKTAKFMSEVVGGRPIFAEPSTPGGFRLRYGKSRTGGIASKSIHPAAMLLLGSFMATGTQVKVEKPGKGCITTECDTIEGPIVRMKNGDVIRVESTKHAKEILNDFEEILFIGDILVTYGDFLQTNTTLQPAGYCEEWWVQELEAAGVKPPEKTPTAAEAVRLSLESKVPLHPRYTYHWDDLPLEDINRLVCIISTADINDGLSLKNNNPQIKKIIENLGIPHRVKEDRIIIEEYLPMLYSLGVYKNSSVDISGFTAAYEKLQDKNADPVSFLCALSPLALRPKSGTYIGARMGRPEKAKERKMQPPVHCLFPIGHSGGFERSIKVATDRGSILTDVVRFECPSCKRVWVTPTCPECNVENTLKKICQSCGGVFDTNFDDCPNCKSVLKGAERRDLDIKNLWQAAVDNLGFSGTVKGVQGLITYYKIPEPLEKGIIRAKHDVYVFKDGTIRFDSTDAPLTHFRPREIDVSVEKLRELGYTEDYLGNDLTSEEQVLALKVQDILLPASGIDYMIRVTRFLDEMLTRFYGLEPFYNINSKEDLLGHLVIGLAPHTSAGITGRMIGFNNANAGYAHPFWHAAKRRNADGDEDSIMLMLDALLNFSRKYLPESRGGQMDAPLVITTLMDPKEVDDEAHKVETCFTYPLEFYQKTWQHANPSDVRIPIVDHMLKEDPYGPIGFTHDTGDITGPVLKSRYVTLGSMADKVAAQLKVAETTRAIDESIVAELVINSHFLRDTYGNLRAFSRQKIRCIGCNESYRRVPLSGKCTKCGGKLLLTVTHGSVVKYLEISINLAEKYSKSDYLKQRLRLLRRQVESVFTNDLSKQMSLSDFM